MGLCNSCIYAKTDGNDFNPDLYCMNELSLHYGGNTSFNRVGCGLYEKIVMDTYEAQALWGRLDELYTKAVTTKHIRNPLAWALHELWKEVDREDGE